MIYKFIHRLTISFVGTDIRENFYLYVDVDVCNYLCGGGGGGGGSIFLTSRDFPDRLFKMKVA